MEFYHTDVTDEGSWRTARPRNSLTKPVRLLQEKGLLKGRCLDYGCGKSIDADELGMDKYDPHFNPQELRGSYDTITCTYVLNTLHPREAEEVMAKIRSLLNAGGNAYLTVRRDIKDESYSSRGFQRNVLLPLPVIYENARFCIYRMRANG